STGPRPAIKLMRDMVTGISPLVKNCEENPPPRKYSTIAGHHLVARRQRSTSSGEISQKGFMVGLPSFVISPVASKVAAPELIRCKMPWLALPRRDFPVTCFTASGLQ